jgi:uncharacterized protein
MILQFSDLISKRERVKAIDYSFDMGCVDHEGEKIKATEPVKVKGNFSLDEGLLELNVDVDSVLDLSCSRCLEIFSYPIHISVNERFTNNLSDEDDDSIFVDSDTIDITEIIANNIISALPIKRLCSENCKGLCQQCGTNLNKKQCSCDNNEIDIRLAKLNDLFSK